MKSIFIIFLFTYFSCSIVYADSLELNGKTKIELINGKEIFQPQNDFWDKYSSGIIAAITVAVSLGISVWQARVSQRHNRSNSIAEARIQWIQELRPLLGKLISQSSEISNLMDDFKVFVDSNTREFKKDLTKIQITEFEKLKDNLLNKYHDFENTFNQIKLFLNRNEKEHNELIQKVSEFIDLSIEKIEGKKSSNDLNEEELIKLSQIVLKNAWEQAKNEGDL